MRRNPSGGLPREQLVADFDILTRPILTATAAAADATGTAVDAELLTVCHEALTELAAHASDSATCAAAATARIQINHPAVLSALLILAGPPK